MLIHCNHPAQCFRKAHNRTLVRQMVRHWQGMPNAPPQCSITMLSTPKRFTREIRLKTFRQSFWTALFEPFERFQSSRDSLLENHHQQNQNRSLAFRNGNQSVRSLFTFAFFLLLISSGNPPDVDWSFDAIAGLTIGSLTLFISLTFQVFHR